MSENQENNIKGSTRILRFIIIGTLNALITAVVIWVMMAILGCNYLWANIAGYTVALIHNFFWSKYWIFSSPDGSYIREVLLFLIAFGFAYGAQFLALLLMVEILGMNEYLSLFLGLFVYGAVNFIMNRRVTFQQKKR